MSFDLKYRPRLFSEVVGNAGVVKLLRRRSIAKTLPNQSMLFGGLKGCGKTSLARIVVRAIYCDDLKDGEPCNTCPSCLSVIHENSPSFDEFDAATQGTAEKIRLIVKELNYLTLNGKPRVCIIDEAHRLSKAAQDAFLKPIEERRIVIIFCTTDPDSVQEAIRSRMEEYPIRSPSETELLSWLERICEAESIKHEAQALKTIISVSEFCPRICVNNLESLTQFGEISEELVSDHFHLQSYRLVSQIISDIPNNSERAIKYFCKLKDLESASWIRDKLLACAMGKIRLSYGVRFNFPVSVSSQEDVNREILSEFSIRLSSIYNPNIYDIESVLFSVLSLPNSEPKKQKVESEIKPEIKIKPEIEKIEINTPKPGLVKSVEIDGISFSSNERLTTLDGKINKAKEGTKVDPSLLQRKDLSHAPIPEKEFAEKFIQNFKNR